MNPQAKVVAGFQPIMPTFQGLVTEEQLLQLIAYVRSLSQQRRAARRAAAADASVDRNQTDEVSPSEAAELRAAELPQRRPRPRVLAVDERPQAHRAAVPGLDHRCSSPSAGFFAMLVRLELLTPAGDLLTSETYNKMFTMHGVVMVFFFLIPSIPAVLGNFLIPIMIGAKDLAFPRINLLSWYIYILGGLFTIVAALSGGVDTGWTFYTPYSTAAANSHVILRRSASSSPGSRRS